MKIKSIYKRRYFKWHLKKEKALRRAYKMSKFRTSMRYASFIKKLTGSKDWLKYIQWD